MHIYKKISASALFLVIFVFAGPIAVRAATPSLGAAATYGILAGTYTNTSATTTINGNIGFNTGPATVPLGTHAVYGPGDPTPTARTDASNVLFTNLAPRLCTFDFPDGAVDLSTDGPNGATGVYPPGVYCSTGAMNIGVGGITLSGSGTYLFRADGALTSTNESHVTLSGASACDVFWTATSATSLGQSTTFVGTVIDNANAITVGANTVWNGRAISLGAGAITTGSTSSITVPTCTSATLTIIKTVNNTHGGTLGFADFPLFLDGNGVTSSVGNVTTVGLHTISETSVTGYAGTIGGDCADDGTITLADGDEKTCTIVNNDIAPSLHLRKTITNDNGGTAFATAWTLTATGTLGLPTNLTGNTPVDSTSAFKADTYTLAETGGPSGYTASSWVCVGGTQVGNTITIGLNQNVTCTITNNDIAPSLHLRKAVILDNGGTASSTAWTLTATGALGTPTNLSGTTPVDSGATFKADTYTLAETGGPSGYTASSWVCVGGTQVGSTITVGLNQNATCTITNDDIHRTSLEDISSVGTINVVKIVINDNGQTKTISDFSLFINGVGIVSGATNTFPGSSNKYVITETPDPNYKGTFSGDCDADGILYLHPNENLFCILTNDDIGSPALPLPIPPVIDLLKIPDPLALPNGAGQVSYTFTVHNIGIVPITDVTVIDDSCSPVTFLSGDANADDVLDLTETWLYSCNTNLSETHTNIAVATGWANGLSTTDIATATVIVGDAIEPPLIHVTKIPDPLTLTANGGTVTYTETVTNPGVVALGTINLTDDKCSPVTYISGDTNENNLLDPEESWIYTCISTLTETTTNTATATGEANGIVVKDIAIVTVVVATAPNTNYTVPTFPKTGTNTKNTYFIWAGILVLFCSTYFFSKLLSRKQK